MAKPPRLLLPALQLLILIALISSNTASAVNKAQEEAPVGLLKLRIESPTQPKKLLRPLIRNSGAIIFAIVAATTAIFMVVSCYAFLARNRLGQINVRMLSYGGGGDGGCDSGDGGNIEDIENSLGQLKLKAESDDDADETSKGQTQPEGILPAAAEGPDDTAALGGAYEEIGAVGGGEDGDESAEEGVVAAGATERYNTAAEGRGSLPFLSLLRSAHLVIPVLAAQFGLSAATGENNSTELLEQYQQILNKSLAAESRMDNLGKVLSKLVEEATDRSIISMNNVAKLSSQVEHFQEGLRGEFDRFYNEFDVSNEEIRSQINSTNDYISSIISNLTTSLQTITEELRRHVATLNHTTGNETAHSPSLVHHSEERRYMHNTTGNSLLIAATVGIVTVGLVLGGAALILRARRNRNKRQYEPAPGNSSDQLLKHLITRIDRLEQAERDRRNRVIQNRSQELEEEVDSLVVDYETARRQQQSQQERMEKQKKLKEELEKHLRDRGEKQ